ncbi:iron-containing alcohol dehydrogenase family protein [Candidatus Poribacteria bacterium]
MMFEMRFPTKIVFGQNCVDQIGAEACEYGDRALLVTGRSAMRKAGVVDKITDLLKASEFKEVHVYDQVEHDPSTETVDRGAELAREGGDDVVIGIGGGSALDAAKAIACMVKNEVSVAEYQLGREIEQPGLPFIAIPTTAGTGAEITKNAVLTNKEKEIKQSVRSPLMIAKVAIVDPLLTVTMPPDVTAATGMDALTQAIESYVTLASNPISDTLALRAISLISQNLARAFTDGGDIDAREGMALGSLMSALAFANSSLGAVHGLAHPMGGLFDVPHGVSCALLLPYIMEYNLPVRITKYAQIAEAMGQNISEARSEEDAARMAVMAARELISLLQLPQHLRDVGIFQYDIITIAGAARGSSLNNNPRSTTPASLQEILSAAL